MSETQQLEQQRLQLISVLNNVADSLRTAAGMADGFAATLQQTSFAQHNATVMNPMTMLQSFAQMFGQNGALAGGDSKSNPAITDAQAPAKGGSKDARQSPATSTHQANGDEVKKRKRAPANPDKKKRDPNMPKKPASAYILFQNDVREEIRKQNPDQPYSFILSKISDAWSALSDEQKQPYLDLVTKNKADYGVQMGKYEAKLAGGHEQDDEPTSPEDVTIPETPVESEAEQQAEDSDDEQIKRVSKKVKSSNKENPTTPLNISRINKQVTPSTKEKEKEKGEKEKSEKKKRDKEKKKKAADS